MKKAVPPVVFGLLAGYVACAVAAREHARRTAQRASAFVEALPGIAAQTVGFNDTLRLARRTGARVEPVDCPNASCTMTFRFDNTFLRTLGLAPRTWLTADLVFNNSRITSISAVLAVAGRNSQKNREIIASSLFLPYDSSGELPPFWVNASGRAPSKAFANLASNATSEQRHLAFDFDLTCLYRIGGCKSAWELAPNWQREFEMRPDLPPPE